jgi:NAD(P)-dependent dehydrogenase (short-subunit alcohol dehydrogenase family)
MDLELRDKVAIVTGGSRGIGKAVARELLAEGASVALVARDGDALTGTAAELRTVSLGQVDAFTADTTDDAAVRAMVARVVSRFGRVDILVNGAARAGGGGTPPTLDTIEDDAVWQDINTKAIGYLRCARAVAPIMRERGWGRIINIGGLAARSTGSTITSMRNVAVVALTKNLADELGPYGINVTCVHPGATRTERTPAMIAARAATAGVSLEDAERELGAGNSLRRLIDAREVAQVVTFLASPRSVAITGDAIAAGGGGRGIYY